MSKIKLNINNNNPQSSNSEIIDRARKQLEERKAADEVKDCKKPRTGLLIFVFILVLAASNIATYILLEKKNSQTYKKYIPKEAVFTSEISPKQIKNMLAIPSSAIFPQLFSKIKTESAKSNLDIQNTISLIQKDIVIASVKNSNNQNNLSQIIIIPIPESFNKQDIENKLKQNFDINYSTYRGEPIATISPLSLGEKENSFAYSIIENNLIISKEMEILKQAIDAGK